MWDLLHSYTVQEIKPCMLSHDIVRKLMSTMEDTTYLALYSDDNQIITKEILAENVLKNSDVYVCGPVLFMKAMIQSLYELGFAEDRVHFEFFGPAVSLDLECVNSESTTLA